MKNKSWVYIVVSIFCVIAMMFIDSRLVTIGNNFIEMRESEAGQLRNILKENYDSIHSISNKDKDALIELYSDKALIAADIKLLVDLMQYINFFVLGFIAGIYLLTGGYKLIMHNKQSQQRPAGWTR